jgi:hypothetical protein
VKKGSAVDVRKRAELVHFEVITDAKVFAKLLNYYCNERFVYDEQRLH